MRTLLKCSVMLGLVVAGVMPSTSQAQGSSEQDYIINKVIGLTPEFSSSQLNEMNSETRDFIEKVKRAESIRQSVKASSVSASRPVEREYFLKCLPRWWKFKFVPSPYYYYITNPDLGCNF